MQLCFLDFVSFLHCVKEMEIFVHASVSEALLEYCCSLSDVRFNGYRFQEPA